MTLDSNYLLELIRQQLGELSRRRKWVTDKDLRHPAAQRTTAQLAFIKGTGSEESIDIIMREYLIIGSNPILYTNKSQKRPSYEKSSPKLPPQSRHTVQGCRMPAATRIA